MLRVFEENDGYFEDSIMMAYDGKHDDHWIGFKENVTGTPYIWWENHAFLQIPPYSSFQWFGRLFHGLYNVIVYDGDIWGYWLNYHSLLGNLYP